MTDRERDYVDVINKENEMQLFSVALKIMEVPLIQSLSKHEVPLSR